MDLSSPSEGYCVEWCQCQISSSPHKSMKKYQQNFSWGWHTCFFFPLAVPWICWLLWDLQLSQCCSPLLLVPNFSWQLSWRHHCCQTTSPMALSLLGYGFYWVQQCCGHPPCSENEMFADFLFHLPHSPDQWIYLRILQWFARKFWAPSHH